MLRTKSNLILKNNFVDAGKEDNKLFTKSSIGECATWCPDLCPTNDASLRCLINWILFLIFGAIFNIFDRIIRSILFQNC
jgi:hypothetical protein